MKRVNSQMDEKRVKIKYRPREQFRSLHSRKQRWSVLVCHRRAGKTVATLNDPASQKVIRDHESGIILPAELADLRRELGEDQYQQEFECSFEAAIKGAFYAEEMRIMLNEGRICPIEIEKDVRVHTAWDLGVSDSTAIWFIQCVGRERRLVDYYESSGVGLGHYVDVLHDKRRKYGWTYGEHFFPHDIKVRSSLRANRGSIH